MLNAVPTWQIALAFAVFVAVCGEIGFRIGVRARASLQESPFAVLQAAVFGLLGLLLAFSFSVGLARYDARRAEVLREANSIGTTILRTQLLDPPAAQQMRDDLRQYIDARIAFSTHTVDRGAQSEADRRSVALQNRMWALAARQAKRDPHSTMVPLFLASLNDTIDQSTEESAILGAHVPDAVIVVLGVVIAFGSVLLGVGFGRTERRGGLGIVLFAIVIALVVGTILDLDRPQRGFIRVSLAPLEAVRDAVAAPAARRSPP